MKKWGLIVIFFLLAVGIGSAQIVFTTGDTLDQSLSISSGKSEPALGAQEILDISTCLELKDISEDLSGDYQLVNDIDCSDTVNWNSGAGFDPLGDGTTQFNGTFDGQNYNISDLFINRSQEYVGLFGRIDTTGEIKDVGLSNFTVQGGSRWTGTLAGYGVNAKFTGIWATGTVIGTTQETGGMIGALTNSAEFNRSWTNVTVIGGNNSGGFAGNLISAELNDVFSHGNIEGDRNVGGLVGFSFGGTIAKSYSTATLSGNSNVGGIIGSFTSATASNSFWDENSSGISTSPLGTGKSTVEMQNVSTFTDTATTGLTAAWDFVGDPNDDVATEDIWDINASLNSGYPYLKAFESYYISEPTQTLPNASVFDGSTTNFSLVGDLTAATNVTLENSSHGKIVWNTSVNVSGADFDSYVSMGPRWIFVDSTNLDASLNSSANLTFYNIPWNTYTIYKDGVECTSCTEISFSGGTLEISAQSFSNHTINNSAPTHSTPILNATDHPTNSTNANLTVYNQSTSDGDGDPITNTYDWRLEGTSLAVLNLPFTENSSTTATDFTTFSNDCTPEGTSSPTWTDLGQYDGAYEYFGTSGYLNCTSAASLDDVGDDGATFMAWIKYDDLGEAGNGVIFTKGYDTLRIDMDESFTNDDSIRFGRDFSDGFKTWVPWQPGISSGTWFHLAITFNDSVAGGLMSIFINGEQPDTPFSITSGISGTAQSDAAYNALVGSNDAETRAFDGIIDEVIYVDRELTDEQINKTYQEGLWRVTVSNETVDGENWTVAVTPGDASGYGTTRTSNTVQIAATNSAPTHDTPILNSTDNPQNSSSANLTGFAINGNDPDGDPISWVFDWRNENVSESIAYFPFNINQSSATEGDVRDFSTELNNGSFGEGNASNVPIYVDGYHGGAYNYSGDDIFNMTGHGISTGEAFTLSGWFKPTDSDRYILNLDSSGSNSGAYTTVSNNYQFLGGDCSTGYSLVTLMGTGSTLQLSCRASLTSEQWYHLAISHNGSTGTIYLNGVSEGSIGTLDIASGTPLEVGGTFGDSGNLIVDEVMMFNTSLSENEVLALYHRNHTTNTSILSDESLAQGENWSVAVTPADGKNYGTTKYSDSITIQNSAPTHATPILNATDNPDNTTNADLNVYNQSTTDADADAVYNIYDWKVEGESIARINLPFDLNETSVATNFGSELVENTITSRVSQGSDDAEENVSTGDMYLTSSDLELTEDLSFTGGNQYVGIRFQNINIPQGARITNATIEFEVDETNSSSTSLTFKAEDEDNPGTFTTTNGDISSRTTTTASVSWNNVPAWNTVNEKKETPDLSAIIQEVIQRPGWSSGNSVVVIVNGTGARWAESYNGETLNAPLLTVTYGAPFTNNGATYNASGQAGGAMDFDGTDDYVDLGKMDVEGDQLTIEAWVNAQAWPTEAEGRIVSKAYGTSEQEHYWMLSTDRNAGGSGNETVRFRLKTDGTTSTLQSPLGEMNLSTWHHVAAVYDGSYMRTYLDGVEIGETAKTGTINKNNTVSAYIGQNPDGSNVWDGLIDEVRIYERALTAEQIAVHAATDYTILDNTMTAQQENWSVSITPNDAKDYGTTKTSNTLTIAANSAPTHDAPVLNATDNPDNTTDANLTAHPQNATDTNGDNITFSFEWILNGSSTHEALIPFNAENNNPTDLSTASRAVAAQGNQRRYSQGKIGGAWEFVEDAKLNISGREAHDSASSTVTFWFYSYNETDPDIMFYTGGQGNGWGGNTEFQITLNETGYIMARYYNTSLAVDLDPSTAVETNSWYHVAVTMNGSLAIMYLNGSAIGNASYTPWSASGPDYVYIGDHNQEGNTPERAFEGLIDEFAIYNRPLTQQQINQLYQDQLQNTNTSTLVSDETIPGQNWSVNITPADNIEYGTTKTSNTIEIQESSTSANGESCTVNGDCTSGYCADSFYNGSDQADLCCAANSCVAGGTCHADLATYGGSTCYDGVWIADGGQFVVQNDAGAKQFVVDKWGSAVLAGQRNASCTTGAPDDSFQIDIVGGQDTWINASGFMCDASASINMRTSPLASLSGTDHFSIVNATSDIVFQRWGVGGSPLHMLGDFADQVGTIS